jgi:hypothetical protein
MAFLLKLLLISIPSLAIEVDAVKGLLGSTTVTLLVLEECRLSDEALGPIQPGSWPCIQELEVTETHVDQSAVACCVKGILHLTGL